MQQHVEMLQKFLIQIQKEINIFIMVPKGNSASQSFMLIGLQGDKQMYECIRKTSRTAVQMKELMIKNVCRSKV